MGAAVCCLDDDGPEEPARGDEEECCEEKPGGQPQGMTRSIIGTLRATGRSNYVLHRPYLPVLSGGSA
jgi:hypothetical protein